MRKVDFLLCRLTEVGGHAAQTAHARQRAPRLGTRVATPRDRGYPQI